MSRDSYNNKLPTLCRPSNRMSGNSGDNLTCDDKLLDHDDDLLASFSVPRTSASNKNMTDTNASSSSTNTNNNNMMMMMMNGAAGQDDDNDDDDDDDDDDATPLMMMENTNNNGDAASASCNAETKLAKYEKDQTVIATINSLLEIKSALSASQITQFCSLIKARHWHQINNFRLLYAESKQKRVDFDLFVVQTLEEYTREVERHAAEHKVTGNRASQSKAFQDYLGKSTLANGAFAEAYKNQGTQRGTGIIIAVWIRKQIAALESQNPTAPKITSCCPGFNKRYFDQTQNVIITFWALWSRYVLTTESAPVSRNNIMSLPSGTYGQHKLLGDPIPVNLVERFARAVKLVRANNAHLGSKLGEDEATNADSSPSPTQKSTSKKNKNSSNKNNNKQQNVSFDQLIQGNRLNAIRNSLRSALQLATQELADNISRFQYEQLYTRLNANDRRNHPGPHSGAQPPEAPNPSFISRLFVENDRNKPTLDTTAQIFAFNPSTQIPDYVKERFIQRRTMEIWRLRDRVTFAALEREMNSDLFTREFNAADYAAVIRFVDSWEREILGLQPESDSDDDPTFSGSDSSDNDSDDVPPAAGAGNGDGDDATQTQTPKTPKKPTPKKQQASSSKKAKTTTTRTRTQQKNDNTKKKGASKKK